MKSIHRDSPSRVMGPDSVPLRLPSTTHLVGVHNRVSWHRGVFLRLTVERSAEPENGERKQAYPSQPSSFQMSCAAWPLFSSWTPTVLAIEQAVHQNGLKGSALDPKGTSSLVCVSSDLDLHLNDLGSKMSFGNPACGPNSRQSTSMKTIVALDYCVPTKLWKKNEAWKIEKKEWKE